MSRVDEIEQAIDSLPPEDFRRIARWVHQREEEIWDQQLDRDSASGKLDSLFDEAESESRDGLLRDWPPAR